jgi:hypothetical protein
MDARELPIMTGAEVARVVAALGRHRYVAGRMHLMHAFVLEAAGAEGEAGAWARSVLADPSVDPASKDERLWRRSTEVEVAAALERFWGLRGGAAREALSALLASAGIAPQSGGPFDETREDDIFPLLIDCGWELLPLSDLDPERHKGAIAAFGEPILFDAARFQEQSAYEREPYLQELPGIGGTELIVGVDAEGKLVAPFTLWTSGPELYHDYVIRGVLRAAKIEAGSE